MAADTLQRRTQAWAGLVQEVQKRPMTLVDLASMIRRRPALLSQAVATRTASADARRALARVCQALETGPRRDPVRDAAVRSWALCVDEIMALTERLCASLCQERG